MMHNLSGAQFKQMSMFPGHEPVANMASANQWAQKTLGEGAQVHYEQQQDPSVQGGFQHHLSVSVPQKSPFGSAEVYQTPVAHMHWNPENGRVELVHTAEQHQGKGAATGLWNIAKSLGIEFDGVNQPKHSDIQTQAGRGWASKVGE